MVETHHYKHLNKVLICLLLPNNFSTLFCNSSIFTTLYSFIFNKIIQLRSLNEVQLVDILIVSFFKFVNSL